MQPVRKISCYDFGLQVQAFADQINGSIPPSIQLISNLVMNVLTDSTWQNPGVGTACRNLSLALDKLPPSDTRRRVKDKLAGMQFQLPKDLIEMILKRTVHKGYGYSLATFLCTCKSFRTIVATEINRDFRQLRAAGLLQEERFAFLDKIEENSYAGYLALKAVVTPTLSLQRVKNCTNIPLALLRMPGLSRLEWDVAYNAEGKVPLELDGLEHAKTGMTITLSHARISTLPPALLAETLLVYKLSSDSYYESTPLHQRFIIVISDSQLEFPLINWVMTKTVAEFSEFDPIEDASVERLLVTQVKMERIPRFLLENPNPKHLIWKVASQNDGGKPQNLDCLQYTKTGMTIEISNAFIPSIPETLYEKATLIFSDCYFKVSVKEPVKYHELKSSQQKFTVKFKSCLFDLPLASVIISYTPPGVVDLNEYLLDCKTLPKHVTRLIVRNVKKYERIPLDLFGLPHLSHVEWKVADAKEGGKPLDLTSLQYAKPGMTLAISNALIPAIPEKVRERAILTFSRCFFKETQDHPVQGHLVPADLQKHFSITFKDCLFDLPFSALGMIESQRGSIERAKSPAPDSSCRIS